MDDGEVDCSGEGTGKDRPATSSIKEADVGERKKTKSILTHGTKRIISVI